MNKTLTITEKERNALKALYGVDRGSTFLSAIIRFLKVGR
jgi:hypothetical protein